MYHIMVNGNGDKVKNIASLAHIMFSFGPIGFIPNPRCFGMSTNLPLYPNIFSVSQWISSCRNIPNIDSDAPRIRK